MKHDSHSSLPSSPALSSEDDSPSSISQPKPSNQSKRTLKRKKNVLSESKTIITPQNPTKTSKSIPKKSTVLDTNCNNDTFADLNILPTEISNRTVIISNCLPHLLTSIPIPDDYTYDITAINETDRVVTFPSRKILTIFTNKYPSTHFGPHATYSLPPNSSKPAPWAKEICRAQQSPQQNSPPPNKAHSNNAQSHIHNHEGGTTTKQPSPFPESSEDDDWKIASNRKKKTQNTQFHLPPTTPTTPTPSSQHPRHALKISSHTINGNNPFFIHHLIQEKELIIEQPNMFWARSTTTTTLTFDSKADLEAFANNIPPSTFGPNAAYSISQGQTQQQTTTRQYDISVVMKDVATTVPLDALTDALNEQQYNVKRIIRIISAQTHKPTDMVRIFVEDVDSSTRLLTGVRLFGRSYRVEASRELVRHRPCARCALYGHDIATCTNAARCWKCGIDPTICKHKPSDNLKYCATCTDSTHYTGQMMCPRYPKAVPPTSTAPTHRPIYTPVNPTPPIMKPSQMPRLFGEIPKQTGTSQRSYATATASLPSSHSTCDIATKKQSAHIGKVLRLPTNNTKMASLPPPNTTVMASLPTQPTSTNSIPDEPTTSNAPTTTTHQKDLHNLTKCVEQYIDEKINELEEKLVTFTLAMFTTHTLPTKRLHHIKMANQAARRVLKKNIRHQFINNQLQITLIPFRKVTSLVENMGLHNDNNN